MTVAEDSERKFQFHLSTVFIFINVAAGLVYGNFLPRETRYMQTVNRNGQVEFAADNVHFNCVLVRYGWPVPIYEYYKVYDGASAHLPRTDFNGSAIIANSMCGVLIGALAMFVANLVAREPVEAKVASQRAQEAGTTISRLKKMTAKEKTAPERPNQEESSEPGKKA